MDGRRRAVTVTAHGGTEVLQVQEQAIPEPGPGQLLVEVAASGVNFIDVYLREGRYASQPPFVLGGECAGRVVAVGPDAPSGPTGFGVGDLVASASVAGSHATHALLDAATTVPVPDGVPADTAAALMLQGLTAHFLTSSTHPLRDGETALVHAAAGGVGGLLVQLAVRRGARVVATAGSAEKAGIARAHGAGDVLRYDEIGTGDALAEAVRSLVPDGVDVVYDGVGAATFDASLASLRPRGLLVVFGAASGPVPPFDLQRLNAGGSLYVTRPTLRHYVASRDELLRRTGELFDAVLAGELTVRIGGRYPLEQAADAYRDLESRATTGKLLIVP